MRVKVIVQSEQLSKDDLRCLLQAIRDCEHSFFREKEIWISAEAPELSSDEMTEVLTSIRPRYEYGPVIFKYESSER
jgi:hypothetical protein